MTNDNEQLDDITIAAIKNANRLPFSFKVDAWPSACSSERRNQSIERLMKSGKIKESETGGWDVTA